MECTTNGVTLHYQVSGDGPPLVLLHGNGEDHTIFDELAAALAPYFTVYAVDSRGHGKSSPVESFSYVEMARDVAGLIQALGLERPLVCGFSDGGIIGLLLAIRYPDKLCALVACGANTRPRGIRARFLVQFWLDELRHPSPLTRLMLTQPHISREELGRIAVPVLVTAGAQDMISLRHTRAISDAIPKSRLVILPGEDHASYIVHSDKLKALILPFWNDHRSGNS